MPNHADHKKIILARPLALSGGLSREEFSEYPRLALMQAQSFDCSAAEREDIKALLKSSLACFTSVNAIRACFLKIGLMPADFSAKPIAAVGERTAAELEFFGLKAEIVPEDANAQALAGELIARGVDRAIFFRAEQTQGDLQSALWTAGISLKEIIVYRLAERVLTSEDEALIAELARAEAVVLFTNGRSVEVFVKRLAALYPHAPSLKESIKLAVIGSSTERSAVAQGLKPMFVGEAGNLEKLIHRILTEGLPLEKI